MDATVRYGNGILPLTDMSLEKYQELTRQISNTAERLNIEKKVTMAPSLSYPGGMGATPAEWLKKTQRYAGKGADIILLDFTQTKVSHEKAIEFLEAFSKKVFPEYRK